MKKVIKKAAVLSLMFFTTLNVNAASLAIEGREEEYTNTSFSLDVVLKGNSKEVVTIGGIVDIEDENCIEHTSSIELTKYSMANDFNEKFAYLNVDGETKDFKIVRMNFKTGENACSTNIKIKEGTISFTDTTNIENITYEKKFNVIEKEKVEEILSKDESSKPVEVIKVENNIEDNSFIEKQSTNDVLTMPLKENTKKELEKEEIIESIDNEDLEISEDMIVDEAEAIDEASNETDKPEKELPLIIRIPVLLVNKLLEILKSIF